MADCRLSAPVGSVVVLSLVDGRRTADKRDDGRQLAMCVDEELTRGALTTFAVFSLLFLLLSIWQARIGFVVNGLIGLLGLVAAATIAFHERLGIRPC